MYKEWESHITRKGEEGMGYIAGIGAANMDIRGRGEGRLIMGDSNPGMLYTTLGGVCRNICENLARLGSDVKLVTVVGDDESGRSIVRGCEAAGIDMRHTSVLEGERSSSYMSILDEKGDKVLDEMIAFSHMTADCLLVDILQRPFDLRSMKRAFSQWQHKLAGRAWNCLYIENHDHPRIISRYGSEDYPVESGKMLAAMYILQRGTPFVYQGQEIGMTNICLPELSMYKDVASHNNYRVASKLFGKKKAMELLKVSSRENARTPVQWSAEKNAGFTTGSPWFNVNPNYTRVNVAAQEEDPDSLLNFYRALLAYRKREPLVLWGDYKEHFPKDRNFYVYERSHEGRKLLVICYFGSRPRAFTAPAGMALSRGKLVFANYKNAPLAGEGFTARPWELRVYEL